MSIYDIEVKDIDMNSIKMEEFKGKTLINCKRSKCLWFYTAIHWLTKSL